MFLRTENLNEGGSFDKHPRGRNREFCEGENPKTTISNRQSLRADSHVNTNWQKLRR